MSILPGFKSIFAIILFFLLLPLFSLVSKYIQELFNRHIDPRTQVGIIHIKGLLRDSHYYTKQLCTFFEDEYIKGILIKIECPGGASGTGQAIFNELRAYKKQCPNKPVVVLVENICTSAAYYIASAADHIIAPPSALVGSIGARFGYLFQLHDLLADYKIQYKAVKAGTYKNITDPFAGITPQEIALLQGVVDDTYQQFVTDISVQRNLSLSSAPEWADGKIFTARQAHKLGLIDQLGSISDAKKVLKEKALIEGEIKWIKPPEKKGLLSLFGKATENVENRLYTRIADTAYTLFIDKCSMLYMH